MKRYVDADKMIEDTDAMRVISDAITIDGIIKYINENATADVEEVVRCKDCIYFKDRHILQNDGVERPYRESDDEYVNLTVGINVSSMCCYEDGKGWDGDKRVFRNKDDFCSRGIRRKEK